MSLSTRQRSSIYQKLVPILGEEDADAMVAEFPASEHDQLVTREHLRAELADLRAELALLRADMHSQTNKTLAAMTGLTFTAMGIVLAFA